MSDRQLESHNEALEQHKHKHPRRFTVVLHNDDYTTQEFVVFVLTDIFKLGQPEAYTIMMNVHKKGRGNVGNYSYDIARTRAFKAQSLAREQEFPLKCSVEPLPGE
jgi:ATP-dependent Clp protease adaptor protein ClpS